MHVFLRSSAILLTTYQLLSSCYKLKYKHWKKHSEFRKWESSWSKLLLVISPKPEVGYRKFRKAWSRFRPLKFPLLSFCLVFSLCLFWAVKYVWPRLNTAIRIYLNLNFMTERWNDWDWHQRRWRAEDNLAVRKKSQQYRWPKL